MAFWYIFTSNIEMEIPIEEMVVSPSIVNITKDVGLRSMNVKYKEENSQLFNAYESLIVHFFFNT